MLSHNSCPYTVFERILQGSHGKSFCYGHSTPGELSACDTPAFDKIVSQGPSKGWCFLFTVSEI